VIRAVGKSALAVLAISALWAGNAQALTTQQVGAGFVRPIYVTSDPGDPNRLFVVEREGMVVLIENGEVKPFADIRQLVSCCGETERGLQSIALAPDFDQSGRFFLFYTGEEAEPEIHVGEMVAAGDTAPSGSLRDLIAPIPHPEESNHYGGQLQFGPDGALYVSTGDGGGSNDEHHNAQDPNSLLGKILQLVPGGGLAIPSVWGLGLRNPFRFSFDRATGSIAIGDVGQGKREEVDYVAGPVFGEGANFGWNCFEGTLPGPGTPDPECATPPAGGYVEPIFEYPHEDPGDGGAFGCAIIGGYVARGPDLGDVYGRYVYGDLCVGEVRSLSPSAPVPAETDRSEGVTVESLNSFGEDSCGRLYAVSGDGPVYRLLGPGPGTCGTLLPPPSLSPSYVGVRAASRKVERNRRGLISAWVSPCNGRRGDPVTLWRGRRNLGTRHLDRVCSARFRPRISRRSSFRVTAKADETYVAAISRRLTIRPIRRHR
jgi:Glucose / Sorbosone dehydrogenase